MYQHSGKQRGTTGAHGHSKTVREQVKHSSTRCSAKHWKWAHNPKVAGSKSCPRTDIVKPDASNVSCAERSDVAGGSAQSEYDKRSARELAKKERRVAEDAEWREAIKERRPVVGRIATALTPKPQITPESQATKAWKVGADGERRVAEVLDEGSPFDDRRTPRHGRHRGSRADLDGVVKWFDAGVDELDDTTTRLHLRAESIERLASMVAILSVSHDIDIVEAPDPVDDLMHAQPADCGPLVARDLLTTYQPVGVDPHGNHLSMSLVRRQRSRGRRVIRLGVSRLADRQRARHPTPRR